jgi:hypothetical protein
MRGRGSSASSCPSPSDLVLLPDSSFISEPNLYVATFNSLFARDFVQTGWEVFMGWPAPYLSNCAGSEIS